MTQGDRFRGPSSDDPEEQLNDLMEKVTRIASEAAARATVNVQAYREGTGESWQKWILGICAASVVMGIGGAIVAYGSLQAIQTKLEYLQEEVTELKKLVEPRYRGQ
jgi:hypothetical protein